MMTNKQAYSIIADHIFIAAYRYSEDFNPVVIFADDMEDAKEKAKKRFGIDVKVWKPKATEYEDIFNI